VFYKGGPRNYFKRATKSGCVRYMYPHITPDFVYRKGRHPFDPLTFYCPNTVSYYASSTYHNRTVLGQPHNPLRYYLQLRYNLLTYALSTHRRFVMKLLHSRRVLTCKFPPEGYVWLKIDAPHRLTPAEFVTLGITEHQEKYLRYYRPKLISEGGGVYVYHQKFRIPKPRLAAWVNHYSPNTNPTTRMYQRRRNLQTAANT